VNKELLEILVCPICRGVFELNVEKECDGAVITGILKCLSCEKSYPIENSIPNLLPPDLRA
jgi:uncharacterized protein YbaR (Trm112 family)